MSQLHAAVIFSSYLAFFVAVITGVLFLLQERGLKLKDPRVLRGPTLPLEALDRINLTAVVVGFGLFSFGMIQGHFLAQQNWGAYFSGDPIEVWSLITWVAYGAVLGLRLSAGLKGRRVVFMSVMSFGLLMFTFLGVHYLLRSRHVLI